MSPVPTAVQRPSSERPAPVQPFPGPDHFLSVAKEIVVDWQLPTDMERKG